MRFLSSVSAIVALGSFLIAADTVAQQGPIFAPHSSIKTSPIWYGNQNGARPSQVQRWQPVYRPSVKVQAAPKIQYVAPPRFVLRQVQIAQPAPQFAPVVNEVPQYPRVYEGAPPIQSSPIVDFASEVPLYEYPNEQPVIDYPIYDSPIVGNFDFQQPFQQGFEIQEPSGLIDQIDYAQPVDNLIHEPTVNGSVVMGELENLLPENSILEEPLHEPQILSEAESIIESPSDISVEEMAAKSKMDPKDLENVPMIEGELMRLEDKIDSNREEVNEQLDALSDTIKQASDKTNAQIEKLSEAVEALNTDTDGDDEAAAELAAIRKQIRTLNKSTSAKQRDAVTQIKALQDRVSALHAANEAQQAEANAEKNEKAARKAEKDNHRNRQKDADAIRQAMEAAEAEARAIEAAKIKAAKAAEKAAKEKKAKERAAERKRAAEQREAEKKKAAAKKIAEEAAAAAKKEALDKEKAAAKRRAAAKAKAAKAAKERAAREKAEKEDNQKERRRKRKRKKDRDDDDHEDDDHGDHDEGEDDEDEGEED